MKKVTNSFHWRIISALFAIFFLASTGLMADICTESTSGSGYDSDQVTLTISSFPCAGGETITAMTMDASVGYFCDSWYSYDILVNGSTIATGQCDQTGYDLTAYLPITSVSIVSVDEDNYPDYVEMELTLNITFGAPAAVGDDCVDPIVIETFPYTDLGQTTCGRGNNYSNTGLGYYDGGEDIFYEFTLTEVQLVNITMDPKGTTWTGLGLFNTCPPGSECVACNTGSSGTRTIEDLLLEPGTYIIMIDTWPSPDCIPDFDLTVDAGPPPPEFEVLNLVQSQDMTSWMPVDGSLEGGFSMTLMPSVEYYYLNFGEGTTTNMPLDPGYFPFYLNQDELPADFFDYWAAKGVIEGASGWQGIMWDIINGNSPMFFIKVMDMKAQDFMLVDGLQYLLEQGDQLLRVNGDYPIGTYTFDGEISAGGTDATNPFSVFFTFANPYPLPFMEPWDDGSFATQQWSFEPEQGNWRIYTSRGQPEPSAEFYWSPGTEDYSFMLKSPDIDGGAATKIFAQFDIYLDNYSTGTIEQMSFMVFDGTTWNVVETYDNQNGSIPWTSLVYDISSYAAGQLFKVGFLAEGVDTYNINWWDIDNIVVYTPGEIAGTVTALDGGAPIEGALITAGPYSGTTEADGTYAFDVYPGIYDVSAAAVGYNPLTIADVDVPSGVTTTVDFQLTAPTMTVDPDALSDVLWYKQTSTYDINITNDGNGPLNWIASFVNVGKAATVSAPDTRADQHPDANNVASRPPQNSTDAMFDLQFVYDATPPSGELNLTGAECDGEYLYSTKWNGESFYKFALDGSFVEEFVIAGAAEIRDLAWDGTYFYGGNAGNVIYVMDFDAKVLIEEITSPGAVRAIAYDSDYDAFWCNNWSSDMLLVDRMGNELASISGVPSIYGAAYDKHTDGGPYLWLFAGTSTGGGCWVEQWSIADGMYTGVMKSVSDDIPDGIAGGLFLAENIIPGTYTLGGLTQADPDSFFGYELGDYPFWATLSTRSGTVMPDVKQTQTIQLTFDAGTAVPGIYNGMVRFSSLEGVPMQSVDLTLEILGQQIMVPSANNWGYISTYVDLNAGKMSMEDALADILDQMTILIGEDGIFWPGFNINTIGDWDTYMGYKIKMADEGILVFVGPAVEDKTVTFQAGTHIIPVLSEFPVSVDDIFVPHGNAIEFAFGLDGSIYWPGGGIMTLNTLEPGYGYLVRFNSETTLDFDVMTKQTLPNAAPEFANETSWNDVVKTADVHVVGIAPEASAQLIKGDYIGIFNANGICSGMTSYTGNDEPMAMAVFGDDQTTDAFDGMAASEPFTVKVFRDGAEITVDPVYSALMPNHDGTFQVGGLSMITDLKMTATGVGDAQQTAFSIYPNPSNGMFNISGVNAQTRVVVTNSHGQTVYSSEIYDATRLDLTAQPVGVYFIKLTSDNQTRIEKVVIE